jgi:predicted enzyme related to lactoylglutathione lyase
MDQGQIIWFEIPVNDLNRAIEFYSNALMIKIKRITFLDQEQGLLDKGKGPAGGVLIEKKDHRPGSGCVLFFYVVDITSVLSKVPNYLGTVITGKTLLKQKNSSGNVIITNNLIDENVGYYAEITDSEGNRIGLYSNS